MPIHRKKRPRDPLEEAADAIADRLVDAVDAIVDRVIGNLLPNIPGQLRPPGPTPRPQKPQPQPRPQPPHSLYDDLEVSPYASQETISAAWKSLSRRYHPDLNKSVEAVEIIRRINTAYEILKTPGTRRLYDKRMGIDRKR